MTVGIAIVLGVLQGLTEFFPVSSSGHLALFGAWFGLEKDDLTFDILVHLATLAAIMIYFRSDWLQLGRLVLRRERGDFPPWVVPYLLVSMVPAAIMGIFFDHLIVDFHRNPWLVGVCLLFNGAVLLVGLRLSEGTKTLAELRLGIVVAMGFAQAIAVLPGVSRSGSTIMCGLFFGLVRRDAARFSFLMAVPVIGGAGILAVMDLIDQGAEHLVQLWPAYGAGFLAALVSGFLALAFLMRLLEGRRFFYFGFYCLVLGLLAMLI